MRFFLVITMCVMLLACSDSENAEQADQDSAATYTTIMWEDLIPPDELDILINPPAELLTIQEGSALDRYLAEANSALNRDSPPNMPGLESPEILAYVQALQSTNVNVDIVNKNVRIPAFLVPLDYHESEDVTSFFLVPYFGACLHSPPPPPNQTIYALMDGKTKFDAPWVAQYVSGILDATLVQNSLATSAYSMKVDKLEVFNP